MSAPKFDWLTPDNDWAGFEPEAGKQLELASDSFSGGAWLGPFAACPDGKTTTLIMVDVLFPNGLVEFNDQNDLTDHTVGIQVQYRDRAANTSEPWQSLSKSYTNNVTDQIGDTIEIPLSEAICPEVRIRRSSAESDDVKVRDTIQLVRLKCELGGPRSYADETTLCVRMRGTNAISASSENRINTIQTRKLNTVAEYIALRDFGTPLPEVKPVTSPGPAYIYATLTCGYPLSGIFLEEIEEIDAKCRASGQTYNDEISDETTLAEFHKLVMRVGYSKPVIVDAKLSARREELDDSFGHLYTPLNTVGNIRLDNKFFDESEPDGIEVEYFPTEAAKPMVVRCGLPGDAYIRPKKMRLRGCNDKVQAYRYGMRERQRLRLKPTQYRFSTEQDALNSEYGEIAYVADSLHGGQQGVIDHYDATTRVITASEPLDFAQPLMWIFISDHAGKVRMYLCEQVAARAARLSEPLHFTPILDGSMERPRFSFGDKESLGQKVVVTEVRPSGQTKCSVTAHEYLPEIFKYDTAYPEG